jgi:hypothetical protein
MIGALPPLPEEVFGVATMTLLTGGIAAVVMFVLGGTGGGRSKQLQAEDLILALLAAGLLGAGSFFALLWNGVYM